jgi:AcrR family transcriptional regulator
MSNSAVEPRVDARIERTRQIVREAVIELVAEEGATAVTHQRVAERSGVGRSTLYRHWPSGGDLLYDALWGIEQTLFADPNDMPLVDWLRKSLRRASAEIGRPAAVQLNSLLIGRGPFDDPAGELRRDLLKRSVGILAGALEAATLRGELEGDPDADRIFSLLVGPVFFRVLFEGRKATAEFIDGVIDQAIGPFLLDRTG